MAETVVHFTKRIIADLPLSSASNSTVYRDRDLSGFILRVGKKTKVFYVRKRVRGDIEWVRIGSADHIHPTEARKRAHELLGRLALGESHREAKRRATALKAKADAASVTLREAMEGYLNRERSNKPLAKKTIEDYRLSITRYLSDWLDTPLREIKPSMIVAKHAEVARNIQKRNADRNGGHSTRTGKYAANLVFRTFRVIYNYARAEYVDTETETPLLPENPTTKLKTTKSWFAAKRRKTFISSEYLGDWFSSLKHVKNRMIGDYLLLLLLTGMRRSEAASLLWSDVDFQNRVFTVRRTKNGKDHTLPMTKQILDIFERRQKERTCLWVFHNDSGDGPLKEPRKQIAAMIRAGSTQFTPHDLRRTFATIAEYLEVSPYTIKKLLNHSLEHQDVTAGYIMVDVERLRPSMEKINQYYEAHMKEG